MALKATLATLEGLDDSLKALYAKQPDGTFALELDEDGSTTTLTGLKSAFIKQKETAKELKARLEALDGITPEQVKELMVQAKKQALTLRIRGKEIKTEDDLLALVEETLGERVAEATKEWSKKEQTYTSKIDGLTQRLTAREIDAVILDAAAKNGVRKTAVPDVLARARAIWKLQDDGPVPMIGDKIIYGKEANKPMTSEEWVVKLAEEAPHLFESSSGSGAGGSGGGSGGGRSHGNKIVYTKEDLASGRADINKIADGTAVVEAA